MAAGWGKYRNEWEYYTVIISSDIRRLLIPGYGSHLKREYLLLIEFGAYQRFAMIYGMGNLITQCFN